MKKLLAIFSLILLTGGGCAATTSVDPTVQETPEGVVEAFYDALMEGNKEAALQLVHPEIREEVAASSKWEEISNWNYLEVEVREVRDSYVDMYLQIEFEGEVEDGEDQAEVVEADGKWWIVDVPS